MQKLSYKQRRAHLEREYRELAKEFNKRALEIEKAGKRSKAVDYIKATISEDAKSKRGNPLLLRLRHRNLENYRQQIKLLKGFMGRETSTLQGVLEVEQRRIETFKDQFRGASELSDRELIRLMEFLGDNEGKVAKQKYDSDQLVLALTMAKIGNKDKSIKEIYQEMDESDKTMADYIRSQSEANKDKPWMNL